jgi:hypothetical protein
MIDERAAGDRGAPIASLSRFTRRARRAAEGERCEMCGLALASPHRHVVDREGRRILCACAPCALAFTGLAVGRFRTVPDRVRAEAAGAIGVEDLRALGVPVGLAFFYRPSSLGRWIGVFPSPAGPTEAELPEGAFDALASKSAVVREIEDDVEALLVRSGRDGRSAVLAVPIDVCWELSALLRRGWRGVDGGDEARRSLDAFFEALEQRANGGGWP